MKTYTPYLTTYSLFVAASLCAVGCSAASSPDEGSESREGLSESSALENDGSIVTLDSGPVKGTLKDGYRTFLGVPYAAPPVGDRRWRSPQPVAPWSEVRDATKFGASCANDGSLTHTPPAGSEDCLYLNVTTAWPAPANAGNRGKPIMVFLHGGAFLRGSGSSYDTSPLAIHGDVVAVTINFRLGVLGHLAHPSLPESGNFGLEDQEAALRWVRRNAAVFGGDPNNVTLMGQSSGAHAAAALLTSPGAVGLFQRVILESGTGTWDWPDQGLFPDRPAGTIFVARAEAETLGTSLATQRGCTDPATAVACLRALSVNDVLVPAPGWRYAQPVFGTKRLPLHPKDAIKRGLVHRIPVMSGTNLDEGRGFASFFFDGQPMSAERYRGMLVRSFGDDAAAVEAHYPVSGYLTPAMAWSAVVTDRVITCPSLKAHGWLGAATKTYTFEFADRTAPVVLPLPPDVAPGALHSSEVPYVMNLIGFNPNFKPEQKQLSDTMIQYWTRFAKTGNPNGSGVPTWSPVCDDDTNTQSLATASAGGIHPVDIGSEHQCAFWSDL